MGFSQLPVLRAKQVIRALERAGFMYDRQKGSHVVMVHAAKKLRTVVPVHSGETIAKPLLVEIIDQADMDIEEFLRYL